MKKILLSFLFLVSLALINKAKAQCTVAISNVAVQVEDTTCIDATHSTVTFSVQFDLSYNNGATFVYFNSYFTNDYNALATTNPLDFDCANKNTPARNAPTAGRLGISLSQPGKSFLDVGLDLSTGHGALGVPITTTVVSNYAQDPTVVLNTPANSGGFTVKRTFLGGTTDHFVISGVTLNLNKACDEVLQVSTDIWASNANSANAKAQCYVCGISQTFNDPTGLGFKVCGNPRTYNLGITTGDVGAKNIVYRVYIDLNDDGVIQDNGIAGFQDDGTEDYLGYVRTDSISLSFSTPFSITGGTYNGSFLYSNKDLLVRISGNRLRNSIDFALTSPPDCISLPVQFKSFNASRTSASNVSISWTTAMEQNSKGFNVQKNVNGEWKTIAFIPSQAQGGNSSSDLTYSFRDANNEKGITQYRIQQVDIDGNAKYSDIRAIRGEGTVGKIVVYPNPSVDGKLNVVFEDNSTLRDVQVNDMQGRVVKSYKGITNNILVIEKLSSGFYTIKITNRNTAATSVEKVVVK